MLLKQLKYFISVVECNNFTEAAEQNYISQSAISQQIQALESELGYKVLIREKRSFTLTPAGKYLYNQSKNILNELDEIKEKAKYIANSANYSIKIGYLKNYSGTELQDAIIQFSKKFPEVEMNIVSGTHEELSKKVFENELDMKFADQRRAFSDDFVNFLICTQYFFIKVPTYSELAKSETLTLENLKDKSCILISSQEQEENESKYYRDILGFKNNFIFANNLEEANLLVSSNKGFLPIECNKNVKQTDRNFKLIPLYYKRSQLSRNHYAFWKKDNNNPIIEKFAEILKKMY